jgi:hypothetical protein
VFTGTLSPDDVAVAMASADPFVFPSLTDTAGNVVLEAQASGLPVVVTNAGGPHENMIAGRTGVVSTDRDDFIRLTSLLARSANRRKWLGLHARAYALERRWEVSLEPLYRAYAEACSRIPLAEGSTEARLLQRQFQVGHRHGNDRSAGQRRSNADGVAPLAARPRGPMAHI